MPKKSTKKTGVRGEMRQINLRLPPQLAEWLDDTASATGMSRDGFIRQILVGVRASWKHAAKGSTDESLFVQRLEAQLLKATEQAISEAATNLIRTTSGRPPVNPRRS